MSRTNVENSFWLWDGTGYQFYQEGGTTGGSNSGSNITTDIPSGVAFFVRAENNPTTGLSVTEAAKSPNATGSMLSTNSSDRLGMTLHQLDANGLSVMSDRVYIRFDAAATTDYDVNADLVKFSNAKMNLSSYNQPGKRLAINVLPLGMHTVPLAVSSQAEGSYSLNFDGLGSFAAGSQFFLQDKFLNTITDLTVQPNYAFSITANAASQGDDRFEIVMVPSAVTGLNNAANSLPSQISIYPNPASGWFEITGGQAGSEYNLISVDGKMILSGIITQSTQRIQLRQPGKTHCVGGVYVLQVRNNQSVSTHRVVISK